MNDNVRCALCGLGIGGSKDYWGSYHSTSCPPKRAVLQLIKLTKSMYAGQLQNADIVYSYLTNFPIGLHTSTIDNIIDFLLLFSQAPSKNTASRGECLVKHFGENNGVMLWSLELLIEKLVLTGFTIEEFWFISGLPIKDRSDLNTIGNLLDPRKYSNNIMDLKEVLSKISLQKDTIDAILEFYDYWPVLAKMVTLRGD